MDSSHSIQHDETDYEYYPLDVASKTLLPDEHEIVLNIVSGQAMLIDWEQRQVRADTCFPRIEVSLVHTLLDKWPSYVEYEKLLPLLITDQTLLEQFTQCVQIARQLHSSAMLNVALAPLHDVIRACNTHLRPLGVQIVPVYESGYLLAPPVIEPEEHEA